MPRWLLGLTLLQYLLKMEPNSKFPHILMLSVTQGEGSGGEKVLSYFMQGIPDEVKNNFTVCAPPKSFITKFAQDHHFQWIAWQCSSDSLLQGIQAFAKSFRQVRFLKPDIIHGWSARTLEYNLLFKHCCKCISTASLFDHPQAAFHSPSRQWIMRKTAASLNGLVCASKATELAVATNGWQVPTSTILAGLPMSCITRHTTPLAENHKIRIGFPGVHMPRKGIQTFYEVAKALAHLPIEWHVFGEPCPSAKHCIADLQAHEVAIISHGRVPLPKLYEAVEFIFHPSDEFDPLPTVLIDAAANGLPVVASDAGGSAEVVDHGVTGLIFPSKNSQAAAECITKLVTNATSRKQMGENASQRFIAHFRSERMVEEYFRFWQNTMSHHTHIAYQKPKHIRPE